MKLSRLLIYIAVTAVSTYLIRVIPLIAIQKKIENRFIYPKTTNAINAPIQLAHATVTIFFSLYAKIIAIANPIVDAIQFPVA